MGKTEDQRDALARQIGRNGRVVLGQESLRSAPKEMRVKGKKDPPLKKVRNRESAKSSPKLTRNPSPNPRGQLLMSSRGWRAVILWSQTASQVAVRIAAPVPREIDLVEKVVAIARTLPETSVENYGCDPSYGWPKVEWNA